MEVINILDPAVDILDKLETLLVPVDQTEAVLLRLHSHQLLILPPGNVAGLATHLLFPAGHIEEHPQVQCVLCLFLVIIPNE